MMGPVYNILLQIILTITLYLLLPRMHELTPFHKEGLVNIRVFMA